MPPDLKNMDWGSAPSGVYHLWSICVPGGGGQHSLFAFAVAAPPVGMIPMVATALPFSNDIFWKSQEIQEYVEKCYL